MNIFDYCLSSLSNVHLSSEQNSNENKSKKLEKLNKKDDDTGELNFKHSFIFGGTAPSRTGSDENKS